MDKIKEIEIKKIIIRIDENKKANKADLVCFDKEGNEYTFDYYDGFKNEFCKQDIICTQVNK